MKIATIVNAIFMIMFVIAMVPAAYAGPQRVLGANYSINNFKEFLARNNWSLAEAQQRINQATPAQRDALRGLLEAALAKGGPRKHVRETAAFRLYKKPVAKPGAVAVMSGEATPTEEDIAWTTATEETPLLPSEESTVTPAGAAARQAAIEGALYNQ